ncbi:MAG: transglycosylase domain-containing protein, partial [Verrucomicrobiota bacterium]
MTTSSPTRTSSARLRRRLRAAKLSLRQGGRASRQFARSFARNTEKFVRWTASTLARLFQIAAHSLRKILGFSRRLLTSTLSASFRGVGRHPRLTASLALLTLLSIVGSIAWDNFAETYSTRAAALDLSRMDARDRGAVITDSSGQSIGRISVKNRKFVHIRDVPTFVIDALVATEDERFFEHQGYDLQGMVRAAFVNLRSGEIKQGASTITQQLARDICRLRKKSFDRKVTEIFLARRLEDAYSKKDILEQYLNWVYFGSGNWGIGSAAEEYFGKDVSQLNLGEAAMLCAIIKSPNRLSPLRDMKSASEARDETLHRMYDAGLLDDLRLGHWLATRTKLASQKVIQDAHLPYAVDATRREIRSLLPDHPLDGLVLETSIHPDWQAAAGQALEDHLVHLERDAGFPHAPRSASSLTNGAPSYLQAALVAIR